MSQVSRPMQIALVATLVFAAAWFLVLRPKPSSGGETAAQASPQAAPASDGGAAPGTAGLKDAIDKAHGAVATANADGAAPAASTPAAGSSAVARPHPSGRSHGGRVTPPHRTASPQVHAVKAALRQHKAVAIAFVDPNTADARAVAQEIGHVSTFGGRAVALAVPLARLSDYAFITNSVDVTVAPTVVIVDRRRQATTIVGFTDRGEIEQRLADAVATKR